MGDLKMTCPSSMTTPSGSRSTVQRQLAWGIEPQGLLHARAEPRDRMFAAAVYPDIEPLRSAPPKITPWVQPHQSAEDDRTEVDASRFVLVVDDDPDLLDVTSFVIETEGMAVETARNGEEALALLRTDRQPRLVLLDLMMPVMNGWEFLAAVANDPLIKGIPVVVLTAAEHTEVPRALEVLSKPMDLTELLRVVEYHVRGDQDAGA